MLNRGKRRSGFTLPEVLVTVAIVAVLAAMVVPAVTQQLGKADAPSFTASLGSLRTAITSFVADVRKFPGDIEDLQAAIDGSDNDLDGADYSTNMQGRWKGPYENSGNAAGVINVGFGWTTTNYVTDSTGYFVVELTKANADSTDANEVEVAIDGGGASSNGTGLIRYKMVGVTPVLDPTNKIYLFLMSSAR